MNLLEILVSFRFFCSQMLENVNCYKLMGLGMYLTISIKHLFYQFNG